MRIGTISLNINAPDFNYGAMLHSWAFQKYLQSLDFVEHTEIIDYIRPKQEGWDRNRPVRGALKMKKKKTALRYLRYHNVYMKRLKKFDKFIKNNLSVSKKQYTQSTLKQEKLDYDTIICESDVIWAPAKAGLDPCFFLALDNMKPLKRIAYAPSMADGNFTEEQEKALDELLKGPQYISCRESFDIDIISKHTDKPVKHVLDPVLLLEPERYEEITAPPLIKEPYLMLYLPVDNNAQLREHAIAYAAKNGLKILDISTKLRPGKNPAITKITAAGMEEYLSAIKHAEMIFTNSFHAICFALLFEKQFYAFTRKYEGKVKDICTSFGLDDYYMSDDAFEEKAPIDYDVTGKLLKQKREDSINWLLTALKEETEA